MPLPTHVDFDGYRKDVAALTREEEQIQSWIADWLPPCVIDAHTHNALREHVHDIPDRALGHMASSFPWQSVRESRHQQATLFPGSAVRSLRFSHPHPGVDHGRVNEWLYGEIRNTSDRFAVFGLQSAPEWTIEQIHRFRPGALKMYHLVTDPPGRTITSVFPDDVLSECENRHLPIILHLPRQITESIEELLVVARRFPGLPIVLAHLGVPNYLRPGLEAAYAALAPLSNVYMDTACMEHADVIELALRHLGSHRIIFGTDDPISLLRVAPFVHPIKGPRVAPRRPMHWTDPTEFAEYGHIGANAVMNHWQQLVALRNALDRFAPSSGCIAAKRQVMHENAEQLYGFV